MESTNYLAFGYVVNKIVLSPGKSPRSPAKKYVAGDWYISEANSHVNLSREDLVSGNFTYKEILLLTSGTIAVTPTHTMVPSYYTRGHSTVDCPYEVGLVKEDVIETTTVFSIVPESNLDKDPIQPNVTILRWQVGSVIEPPVKFFLADGSFRKGNVEYSTTGAYSLSSGNIEIMSECLGFIFHD